MTISFRGRWATTQIDEYGKLIFGSINEQGYPVISSAPATVPITINTPVATASVSCPGPNITVGAGGWMLKASEDFSVLPSDIIYSAGVSLDSSEGSPAPSLRSDGMSDWWYTQNTRFYADGNFKFEYDILFKDNSLRDISNFAFWMNDTSTETSNTTVDGFMFRLQTVNADGGFYVVTNGSHGSTVGTQVTAVNAGIWYHVTLTADGTVVTAEVKVKDSGAIFATVSFDFAGYFDATHMTKGYFGQKHDGAGSTNGHRWDNLALYVPGTAAPINIEAPFANANVAAVVPVVTASRVVSLTTATSSSTASALAPVVSFVPASPTVIASLSGSNVTLDIRW